MHSVQTRWSPGRWGLLPRLSLLLATLAVLGYMVVMAGVFDLPRPVGIASFLMTLAVIVAAWGLIALYLVDVFANPRLGLTARVVWSVALVIGTVVAMVVYWALYLLGDLEDQRREGARGR